MKRKIVTIIYIMMVLITIKLAYTLIMNRILINQYNNGQYSESQAKALTYMNYLQSYVANYNYGNILYQNGEYESAIEQYQKALKTTIPMHKECAIRINYALAICKTIEVNEKDEDSIKDAIKMYESAIDVLTEEGCANKNDDNGHNDDAEQLKKDIQKEIDRLKKLQKADDHNNTKEQEQKKDSKMDQKIQAIENKIQDIKENATKKQRELEGTYKTYHKNYNNKGKNW